jgi:hypothetical protein
MPLLNQSQDAQLRESTLNDVQGSQINIVNNFRGEYLKNFELVQA